MIVSSLVCAGLISLICILLALSGYPVWGKIALSLCGILFALYVNFMTDHFVCKILRVDPKQVMKDRVKAIMDKELLQAKDNAWNNLIAEAGQVSPVIATELLDYKDQFYDLSQWHLSSPLTDIVYSVNSATLHFVYCFDVQNNEDWEKLAYAMQNKELAKKN